MEYRTIAAPVSASFVEKKSEFIAQLFPVRTQEDAVEAIENVRKQHRRARHNVYAYLLREGNASRYSDDGEPQGTAGMPILDVLQKNGRIFAVWSPDISAACCWERTGWCGHTLTALPSPLKMHRSKSCSPAIRFPFRRTMPCTGKSRTTCRRKIFSSWTRSLKIR